VSKRRILPDLPAALIPIYGTTLADVLCYTLMIPLLPELAAQYHATYFIAATLISVPALCSTFSSPVWGRISDRVGRKSIILFSQGVTLVGYVMLALAHSMFWIFIARVVSGLGAGNISAVQSYIADVTKEHERDEGFALYGVVFGAAFVVGPVISAFLMQRGLQFPFYVAALLEFFNILFTAALIPWSVGKHEREAQLKEIVRAAIKPGVRRLFLRQFLFVFAVVYFLAGFALYLHAALNVGVEHVAWLMAGAGIVGGIVQGIVVSPLAARIGDRLTAQLGFAALLLGYGFLYWVHNLTAFVAVLSLWAIGAAMVEPTIMALLSLRIPARQRGALMGVGDSLNNIALVIAPAASGAIIGANAQLIGILPAVATLAALAIGAPRLPGGGEPNRR
jgi:MFS transporter, DHA1 family, tetracycline resistance protein